ncbi:MAG TPA: histidine kinase [Pyrinomonadaceae bacterium]|nr:histidine kinase [Pyrinomonadaceae bacterium]
MIDSPTFIPPIPLRRNRFWKWAAVLGIWIVLGVIYAGPIYLEVRAEGMNHSAARIFGWGILTWSVWALLTPAIVWLGRRFSLIGAAWKRSLAVHIPAFLIISAVHTAAATFITLTVAPFDHMGDSPLAFLPRFLSRLKGAFGSDLLVYGGILGVCYAIDYYRKYREREFLASQLEAQLAQAQLDSLRMQLHPHFLFNTLNGIVGLVRDNKNQAAVSMLVGLSDLLRHALEHSSRQEVELREELNFIKLYLDIQQMRFSDRLQIELDIQPDTIKCLVPNLILQPLVENALRHGIAHSAADAVVGIRSKIVTDSLELRVFDNGSGLANNWQLRSSNGIGLANTAARLQQLYNGNHRFDVRNRDGGGVEVVILIPLRVAS